jgi:hypothetical protein
LVASVCLRRFSAVTAAKAAGIATTPKVLADFVAGQVVGAAGIAATGPPLRVLDPAVGDGALLLSLVEAVRGRAASEIQVFGYETDPAALKRAEARLKGVAPRVVLDFTHGDFLERAEGPAVAGGVDLVIANPPYVRTQILGASHAREIARRFGLKGRVDLAHAFLPRIAAALKADGVAGVIVSNRFMVTRAGEAVRRAILRGFALLHVWDFGDTKLFDAAVLPAVLLLKKAGAAEPVPPRFTSIYETFEGNPEPSETPGFCGPERVRNLEPDDPQKPGVSENTRILTHVVDAVAHRGVVAVDGGRRFRVVQGTLAHPGDGGAVWRVATEDGDRWLETVHRNRWGTFRDVGKVRVGVKTCADGVFIRDDWHDPDRGPVPELLRPLTTHHVARRFRALETSRPRFILYPHEIVGGVRRAVDLAGFPASRAYLEARRPVLEGRTYVLEAGRAWYEVWVPQDPSAWERPKLVFRDIADEPTFWFDPGGPVVNGDCYWMLAENVADLDLLWLAAAVGNTEFIATYYDRRFPNKLYAGRRRFITQYVEEFPLPDPAGPVGRRLIATAKAAYHALGSGRACAAAEEREGLVREAFGLRAGTG